MKLDSLPTTHPIVNKVDDANAALQMFDQISYFKASSVIRMLADHIGQDAFLSGLTNYLNKHAYKNATSEDLWEALGLVSGVNVSQLMDSWVHIPSFPIARLANEGESRIILQKSILANDAQTASSSWDIPVKLLTGQTAESVSLNAGHVGYLCVDYDAAALSAAINASSTDVSPTDIVGVICDLGTMALNATKPTSHLLDFIWAIRGSRDGFVWLAISRSLTLIRSIFSDDEAILQDLKSFTALLVHDVRDQLTWGNDEAQLGYTEAELCKVLIALGFDTGDASVIREARARFDRWAAGDASALHPSLRGVILASCISNGTPADFDAVKRAFETDPSLDGQEIFLSALGAVRDPAMATALLDYAFAGEDSVPLQHIPLLGSVMGANIRARELQWQYAKDNWARVRARLDRNSTCRDWWIEESFRHLSDPALADDIEAWFRDRSDADTRKQVDYIRASIRRNAAYKQFARDDVAAWLQRKVQA